MIAIRMADNKLDVISGLMPFLMSKQMTNELGEHPTWQDRDFYFFAERRGSAIAFACLSAGGRLKYVYTHPAHRRQGCFTLLVDAAEAHAKRDGMRRIVATATDMALPYYLRRGYEVTKGWKKYHNITKELQ